MRWMVVMWWMVCESEGSAEKDGPAASLAACMLLLAMFPVLGWDCSPTVEGSWPRTPTPPCLLLWELTRSQGGPHP